MSKDRFQLILSNLHLVDNDEDQGTDRLYKVRPFISMVKSSFQVYEPEEELSFDEGTCPFKGRVRVRVYNPMKPNKFGIKVYQISEARSGYCVGFDVYDGSEGCTSYVEALDLDPEELSTTTKVVVGLLSSCGLLQKGHKVYMDNYNNSPELFEELELLQTYAAGTVRINRKGMPRVFGVVKNLKPGEVIFRRRGNLLAVKYHDKRDVHVISTFHRATMYVQEHLNRNRDVVRKPTVISDYCKLLVVLILQIKLHNIMRF
ncbi:piggyBac transposable element-derived protein 4-like [Pecten maximus]|uniref:piggyBac transposable element-derived protein 4-like n=1 Tax=Pecten maximus TaxID=6579 RepID=UPI0014581365|nr:piggyBac transposable element-derived protein 4-like [Pecten maximus]